MPTYADNDLAAIIADAQATGMAVTIVIGTTQLSGFVDFEGRDVLLSGGVSGASATDITVAVQTSALPSGGLKNRTPLTVDGAPMRLRDSQLRGDGGLTYLTCEQVP